MSLTAFRPFRQLKINLCTNIALHRLAKDERLPEEARKVFASIRANKDGSRDEFRDEVSAGVDGNPKALKALDAEVGIDPNEHPFLAWLLSPEGIAFIYAIATIIASIWGIHLPPLPPLPPSP